MEPLAYRKMGFEEFCAAAISVHQLEALEGWEQIASDAFDHFEQEGNRVISVEELARVWNISLFKGNISYSCACAQFAYIYWDSLTNNCRNWMFILQRLTWTWKTGSEIQMENLICLDIPDFYMVWRFEAHMRDNVRIFLFFSICLPLGVFFGSTYICQFLWFLRVWRFSFPFLSLGRQAGWKKRKEKKIKVALLV